MGVITRGQKRKLASIGKSVNRRRLPYRFFTDEERARYYQQVKDSDGFDVESFDGVASFGAMIIPIKNVEDDIKLIAYAKLAIRHYKDKVDKGRKLKFHKIVKANESPGRYYEFYITFECKDAAADNEIKTFQALVVNDLRRFYVEICREKRLAPIL